MTQSSVFTCLLIASCVAVVVVLAAEEQLATSAKAPAIPCTFSMKYREVQESRASLSSRPLGRHHAAHHGHYLAATADDYDVTMMWYQIEGKATNQDGAGNTTFIWTSPNVFTIISPFFTRRTCVKYHSDSIPIPGCPTYPAESTLKEKGVTCPSGSSAPSRKCDHWFWTDSEYSEYHDAFFLTGTNIPVQITIENEDMFLEEDFIDFNTSTPDASYFLPAPDQPCTDLTDDNEDSEISLVRDPSHTMVNSPQIIEEIAQRAKAWKPAAHSRFDGMTFSQIQESLLPVIPAPSRRMRGFGVDQTWANQKNQFSIPDSFDARLQWGAGCPTIGTVRNQAKCGSCWAFSTSESLADRICVAKHNNQSLLSPQYLMDCSTENNGCEGGYLDEAWYFTIDSGVAEDNCIPYEGETHSTCPTQCQDHSVIPKLSKAKSAYSPFIPFDDAGTIKLIQQDIMQNGPIGAAFFVFDDFYNYGSGVYSHVKGSKMVGGHAILISGWGVDETTKKPFWLIKNSWGEDWGEKGWFRMIRGTNEGGIESQVASGIPL